jgi:hypothetical protein
MERRNATVAIRNMSFGFFGVDARPLAMLCAAQAAAMASISAWVKR